MLRAHAMARPYSDDLRQKLLEAYDQGQGSLAELAEQFMERETGIEPATFSLGMWRSIENKEHGVYPISFWR